MLPIILYVFAFVLALVATFWVTVGPPPWKLNLGWLAFAFFVAAILVDKGVF